MASGFPGSIDNFTDPLSNSSLSSPSHSGLHSDVNDAIEKIETYMGLVKVIPTGATNGTVSADGDVTIGNAVSSVTVSGAFSALYDSYRILVQGGTGTAATAYIELQLGATTSNYRYDYIFGNLAGATPSSVGTVGSSRFGYAGFAGAGLFANLEVMNPFAATQTMVVGPAGRSGNNMGMMVGVQVDATSFTAFTISVSSGTMTGGTIRVYGYRN